MTHEHDQRFHLRDLASRYACICKPHPCMVSHAGRLWEQKRSRLPS